MRALCCHGGSASLGSSTRCPVDAGAAAAAAQHVCLLRPLCRAPLGAPVRADGCAAALRVRVRFSCARREQQRVAARTANARPAVSNPNHLRACPHSAAPRFARVARCRRPPQRWPIPRARARTHAHERARSRARMRALTRTRTHAHHSNTRRRALSNRRTRRRLSCRGGRTLPRCHHTFGPHR